jgi:hypothetical protein
VNKSVTYGTVTNIPGETAKCWITRNLGASQQATEVNDATEASAGWYWQFNRKQGYKHDGSVVTPSWTITTIDENSDWQAVNDPCTFELGTGWRIPTNSEWGNVNNASGWANWTGPWSSGLKMHGAGYLNSSNAALADRGSHGYNWSSTQNLTYNGWVFDFSSGFCGQWYYQKAHALPLRCIRN